MFEDSGEADVYGKKAVKSRVKIASIKIADNMTLELLQVLEGNSVERDWLRKHGESVHHIGIRVKNVEEETLKWIQKGIKVIQEDHGKFAYLDTEDTLGMMIELFDPEAFDLDD